METPSLRASGQLCISFDYHMAGSDIGSLIVYSSGNQREQLFRRSGNQEDEWQTANIETEWTSGDKVEDVESSIRLLGCQPMSYYALLNYKY